MQGKINNIKKLHPRSQSCNPGINYYQFLFISIYFYLFLSVSLFSQPDSLTKYLEIAAKNNPIILQRFTEYEASLKKIPQAGSLPDPQLDLGVFLTPMELVGGRQVADLKLMQMFPWFGVLKNARDEMSLMAKAKLEMFRDSKLQVYYDVQRTWYELFRIRKDISISEKNIDILSVIEKLTLSKYKSPATENSGSMQSGSMQSSNESPGLTDLYRIQIEEGELKNNIAILKNQEQTIMSRLNSYLNRPPMASVFTGEILLPDTLTINMFFVPDSIQKNNPMLNMIDYEKEAYEARMKMVTGMGYPMIGLGLNYSVIGKSDMSSSSMNGNDMLMPMISVTLPIYRKKYTAMREEADLLSKSSSLNYTATSNYLNTEYYSAVHNYQDAKRRIKLYADQYMLAYRSFEILMKSYSASAVSLTDVLRSREQILNYEIKQVEAVTDLNTAKALLTRLMANLEIK